MNEYVLLLSAMLPMPTLSNWPQKSNMRVYWEKTTKRAKTIRIYNFLLNIFDSTRDASLAFLSCRMSDFFYFSLHLFTVFEEKTRLFVEPKIIMWWKTREQRGKNFSNKQDFILFLLFFSFELYKLWFL